jgi:hypothetical protein
MSSWDLRVDLPMLQTLQSDALKLADDLGVVTKPLTDKELTRFGRAFCRQFVLPYQHREVRDIHMRHQGEALLGAMIAKEQMNAEVDSELPASNKIGGPIPIRASYLGIGEDWEDILGIYAGVQGNWTTGAVQNWIHSGTTLMAGTAANDIRIGENALHVIYGYGSLHASPKIESVEFRVDGKVKPTLLPMWATKQPDSLRIKEFDNAIILKKDTQFRARIFISRAFGEAVASVLDYPYLFGVMYIKEPQLRILRPTNATVVGVTPGIVLTT